MDAGHFEHYRLDGLLGEGTFGTVYRAVDIRDRSVVAVKVFDRGDAQVMLSTLRAEARAMRAIEDPNCVRVLDVIEQDPPALVSEYVDGATLRAVLNSAGRLTGRQALDVVRGALRGLDAVHRAGLRHGDVKPDNILIDRSGVSRLIDFGLVQPSPQPAGALLTGSPAYMSPEQVSGGAIDHRSDLYAFAAILFELLTGTRPFTGDTLDEVMGRHVADPVPDAHAVNPAVSITLAAVCSTGLAKDPADRYQSAADFLRALEAAARHTYGPAWATGSGLGALAGAAARTVVTTETADRGPAERRVPVRGLAVTGAVVVVLVVGLLVWNRTHRPSLASARRITPSGSVSSRVTPRGLKSSSPAPHPIDAVGSVAAAFVVPHSVASNSYYAASCPTAQVCLATGQTRSGRPLESVTRNGGATWTTTSLAVPGTLGLLSCSDPTTCVAGYFRTTVHMRRTVDGGRTWLPAATPPVTNLQSIACPTAEQCLAVGGAERSGAGTAQAIATADGGTTWHKVAVPAPASSVSCADAAHCWVSGSFDKVWATDAAGATWRSVSPPPTFPPAAGRGPFPANTVFPVHARVGQLGFYLVGVSFGSDTTGIAFGGALCGGFRVTRCRSGVYRTTDGAKTWTLWPAVDQARYGDGEYAGCVASRCVLVTDTFTNSVLVSTADGTRWSQRQDFAHFVGRVSCSRDGATCVVIGSTGLWVAHG